MLFRGNRNRGIALSRRLEPARSVDSVLFLAWILIL